MEGLVGEVRRSQAVVALAATLGIYMSVDNGWGMNGGVPLERGVTWRVLGQHWAAELGRGRGWRRWPHFRYPQARNKPQTISQANFSPSGVAENWAAAKP